MAGDLVGALRTAQSGLLAQQAALDIISQNVANANTDGYSRKSVNLQQQVLAGNGAGVVVGEISRNVDEGLVRTLRGEISQLGKLDVSNSFQDRLQSLFGTPDSNTSLAHTIADFQAAIESLASTPESTLNQMDFLQNASDLVNQLSAMSDSIQQLRVEADKQIGDSVTEINTLLQNISDLNQRALRNSRAGYDVSDLYDQRDQALDRLSELMDIKVYSRARGDVVVFAANGSALVDGQASTLTHRSASLVGASTNYAAGGLDGIYVGDDTADNDLTSSITQGNLAALIEMRDSTLPDLQSDLDALAATLRDVMNQVHNQGTSYPGARDLNGTKTFVEPDAQTVAFNGTGDTALVLFDSSGEQVRSTTVRSLVDPGNTGAAVTIEDLVDAVNTWLGVDGSATIDSEGKVHMSLSGSGVYLGIRDQATSDPTSAIADVSLSFDIDGDGTTDQVASGFSNFFGLNDLFVDDGDESVQDSQLLDAGYTASSGTLNFVDSTGVFASISLNGESLNEMAEKIDALSGVSAELVPEGGRYRLRITSDGAVDFAVAAGTGALAQELGLKASDSGVASSLAVRSDIVSAPQRLASAVVQYDPDRGISGSYRLGSGDNTNAQAMAEAMSANQSIPASGRFDGVSVSFSTYATTLISTTSSLAQSTKSQAEFQSQLVDNLTAKSDSIRGVNLDEELSNLVLYEQAYSASARVMSVIQDLFKTLDAVLG